MFSCTGLHSLSFDASFGNQPNVLVQESPYNLDSCTNLDCKGQSSQNSFRRLIHVPMRRVKKDQAGRNTSRNSDENTITTPESGVVCATTSDILKHPTVLNELEKQIKEAKSTQQSISLARKIPWATSDRAKLTRIISNLRTAISKLEGLFQTRTDARGSLLLRNTPETESFFQSCHTAQLALLGLHKTLMRIRSGDSQCASHLLSLQVRGDPLANRLDLEYESYVRLRKDSNIFNLLQQMLRDAESEAQLLLVDSAVHEDSQEIAGLDQRLQLPGSLSQLS